MRTSARARRGPRGGFGAADPHVAAAKNNLAELYRLQRRYEEAEALYAEAAAALERHYGASHPASGVATHNLAGCRPRAATPKARTTRTRPRRGRNARRSGRTTRTTPRPCSTRRRRSARAATARARRRSSSRRSPSERAGQGESSPALRRRERLAQVQGDVLGNHAAAEATRRKVARARARRRCGDATRGAASIPRGTSIIPGDRPPDCASRRSPLPSARSRRRSRRTRVL